MGPAAPVPRPRSCRHSRGNARSGPGHISATLAARARPTSSSRDQLLPLLPALAPLFPRGGLQRGGVVTVGPVTPPPGASPAPGGRPGWHHAGVRPPRRRLGRLVVRGRGHGRPGDRGPGRARGGPRAPRARPPPGPPVGRGGGHPLRRHGRRAGPPARAGAARGGPAAGRPAPASAGGCWWCWGPGGGPRGPTSSSPWSPGRGRGSRPATAICRARRLEVVATGRRAAARPVRVGLWLPAPSGQVVADARTSDTPAEPEQVPDRVNQTEKQ